MSGRCALCAAAAIVLFADAALAQSPAPSTNTAPTSQPPPQGDTSATQFQPLTVPGRQPDYRRYGDRRSYSLTADLHATNDSIGDALRNIPSVDVNPRLRRRRAGTLGCAQGVVAIWCGRSGSNRHSVTRTGF
jgi:hypothetical protein